MPANSLVQTRINSVIKEEASIVLHAIGLTVSDAVRLMLTRVAREKALPFEPLIPNEATIAAMKEAREGKLETVTLDDLQAVSRAFGDPGDHQTHSAYVRTEYYARLL